MAKTSEVITLTLGIFGLSLGGERARGFQEGKRALEPFSKVSTLEHPRQPSPTERLPNGGEATESLRDQTPLICNTGLTVSNTRGLALTGRG